MFMPDQGRLFLGWCVICGERGGRGDGGCPVEDDLEGVCSFVLWWGRRIPCLSVCVCVFRMRAWQNMWAMCLVLGRM